MTNNLSNSGIIDTRFRVALDRMARAGRLQTVSGPTDTHLEIAGLMKKLDDGPALLFAEPSGFDIPVVGNVLSNNLNCEAAFGLDKIAIRQFVARALADPLPPQVTVSAPCQDVVIRDKEQMLKHLPVLFHAPDDSGRFITAGVVIVQDPETGVYNASYHRLQIMEGGRTGIKLDLGRHLRIAFERAQKRGEHLPVAVCIGSDIALQYAAATMGAQLPECVDELAAAGGLSGRPMPVVKALTQDLLIPVESEIVLEGRILIDETVREGPFGEFIGFSSPQGDAPVFDISAVSHRNKPIYHAINGYGRETVMLRKYVMEASLLKGVQPAVPIVSDAEMTAGGLHRFHAVIKVNKQSPQHDGLQRNAILAAFATLKDLDMVIAVDDDIDITDPHDVEYALATRMEASRDIFQVPAARGHEYIRVSDRGMRTKLGIDATVPFERKAEFTRLKFADFEIDDQRLTNDPDILARYLGA
jgi:2,5-furandicarboxylate decarboxylase 1